LVGEDDQNELDEFAEDIFQNFGLALQIAEDFIAAKILPN
jgi:hypothetical protein